MGEIEQAEIWKFTGFPHLRLDNMNPRNMEFERNNKNFFLFSVCEIPDLSLKKVNFQKTID